MKRNLLHFSCFLFFIPILSFPLQAQVDQLLGRVTGGIAGSGGIFAIDSDGSNYFNHKAIGNHMYYCYAALMEGSDCMMYGSSYSGGIYDEGTVFRMEKDGSGFEILHHFDGTDGANLYYQSQLLEASDGWIYGVANAGGTDDAGVIFKLQKDGTGFVVIHEFEEDVTTNGDEPYAALQELPDGMLYGTTYYGGLHDYGIIFKIAKDGTGFSIVHSFDDTNGSEIYDGFTLASDGKFYGVTWRGGADSEGILYRINPDGTGFENLMEFTSDGLVNGSEPYGFLVEDNGYIFGTTWTGGNDDDGVIYKVKMDGTGVTILHHFENTSSGENPNGLIMGSDGRLYGSTKYGGINDDGVIFSIKTDGSDFQLVHEADEYYDGEETESSLVEGSDGNLYVGYQYGGIAGYGTVFKIAKDGSNPTTLIHLYEEPEVPGGMILASDGFLYGYGGEDGGIEEGGFILKMMPDGAQCSRIFDFGVLANDGWYPAGKILEASDGWLYGNLNSGGANSNGAIFKIRTDGTGYAILHDFPDLEAPESGLIEGSDGYLYGVASFGGAGGKGGVFKIAKDGTGFMSATTGMDKPSARLIECSTDGMLYGTFPNGGGSGSGEIFKIAKDFTGFSIFHTFSGSDGSDLSTGVLEGSDGHLYGVTKSGGTNDDGVVYKIAKDGTGFSVLHHFEDAVDGDGPSGELVEGTLGALFGTTLEGGTHDEGTVFSINKNGTGFSVLHHFEPDNELDAINPAGDLILLPNPISPYLSPGCVSACNLPSNWTNQDIGNTGGIVGTACYAAGEFTIDASGNKIAGAADGIHYVYLPHTGNVDIIARVHSIKNATSEQAGVMLRETLNDDSPEVSLVVNGKKKASLYSRFSTGATTATRATKNTRRRLNSWLRLSRYGNNVLAYYSRNGVNWEYVGNAPFVTGGGFYVGLVTTTSKLGKFRNYVLDNISVDGTPYRLADMQADALQVQAFPNPFSDRLSLNISTAGAETADVLMINQLGQVVKRESLSLLEGEIQHALDLSQLSAGVYFLRVRAGEEVTTVKVVKE